MKRRLCIVTGSRAEYGLLRPLMEEIRRDASCALQVIATGMHLSAEFGHTYREIERDGFRLDEKVEMLLGSDTPASVSKSMGLAMIGFADAYRRLAPDCVVLLGDRFEIFSAAAAALTGGLPIAHIHGGELTEGAIDDAFRHSITKMSHLHFTALEEYRQRVIQLGERPERVFTVGALGLDSIRRLKLLTKREIERRFGIRYKKRNLLVTFHPATAEEGRAERQFRTLLRVLDELNDTTLIFTKANADAGGRAVNALIDGYAAKNPGRAFAFSSMGQLGYLSAMKHADAVVGNSSSGIIEAPSFKRGAINIGDRQKGRVRAGSVIDVEPSPAALREALATLYSPDFQKSLKKVVNPYGDGRAAERIKDILKKHDIKSIRKKTFYTVAMHAGSPSCCRKIC